MSYLRLDKLTDKTRKGLLGRQTGEADGLIFYTNDYRYHYLAITLGLLWFAALFLLTDSFQWSVLQTITTAVVSAFASYFLFEGIMVLVRSRLAQLKPSFLVTPHYLIDIQAGYLRHWNLEQLINISGSNRYHNGSYKLTEITLRTDDLVKVVVIRNVDRGEEVVDQISLYRKLFIEAVARNDISYLSANDDFIDQPDEGEKLKVQLNVFRRVAMGFVAVIFSAGLMFGAVSLNRYFDDKKSWEQAQFLNRASAYRSYMQTHPNGRWGIEANQALQSIYEAAEQHYRSSLKNGFDPEAAKLVSDVLRYARTTGNFRANMIFERHNEIPPNLIDEIKKAFDVKNVLPLGDAFSSDKMEQRQSRLEGVISDAFRQVIPDDILEISRDCQGDCVTLSVAYNIDFKNSIYFDLRQKSLPESEKTFYPGISINWNFRISVPNRAKEYRFDLNSAPADEISYDTESDSAADTGKDFAAVLDADKGSIYDSMVSSAFDDFRKQLMSRFGVEPTSVNSNPPPAGPSPSPSFLQKGIL